MNALPHTAAPRDPTTRPVLELDDVTVVLGDRPVLRSVSWAVSPGERWVVLGRNGSGKTTLVQVASFLRHPSAGRVTILGETLGETDVRALRPRVGVASSSMADRLRPGIAASDVVMTARHGALEPWWHTYTDADRARAAELLDALGVASVGGQAFGTLSSGERQRVLLARTLMNDPALVLLDEPTAGLDLAGREDLIAALDDVAERPDGPPMVLVTHHVEEVPARFTHALLLRDGAVLASGAIDDHLRSEPLSRCFGLDLVVERRDGRWAARAASKDGEPTVGTAR